jgi:hypothetical protein
VHDPDIVNFSPSHGHSLDDFVTISHPTQGFGKMISKAPAGAATQSIDRSSQHLQITQALAKDL